MPWSTELCRFSCIWKHCTWGRIWNIGVNMGQNFWGACDGICPVLGLITRWSVITQAPMASKPTNLETWCTKCDQYRIAGVVVCINYRAKTWRVGVVSIYNMFLDGHLICILWLRWTAWHNWRNLFLEHPPFSLMNWVVAMLVTGHRW